MTETFCSSCRNPKVSKNPFHCGLCNSLLCKECIRTVDDGVFSFLKEIPEELAHATYCNPCYDAKVAPALESYEDTMARAREVVIYFKNERNLPPHRRANKPVSVKDCPDRKEAILRLAFFAAERGCNALMNIDLHSEKIQIAGYQKTHWSGTAYPVTMAPETIKARW